MSTTNIENSPSVLNLKHQSPEPHGSSPCSDQSRSDRSDSSEHKDLENNHFPPELHYGNQLEFYARTGLWPEGWGPAAFDMNSDASATKLSPSQGKVSEEAAELTNTEDKDMGIDLVIHSSHRFTA